MPSLVLRFFSLCCLLTLCACPADDSSSQTAEGDADVSASDVSGSDVASPDTTHPDSPITDIQADLPPTDDMIIDHRCTDLSAIPTEWINRAREDLHIAYGHTSHGSQLTTGMTGLVDQTDLDGYQGDIYGFSADGADGTLHIHESFAGYPSSDEYARDLGNPNRTLWEESTRGYLADHPETNVIIWSWCGQVSSASEEDIDTYLTLMNGLERDFPGVRFVYMTGHLDGSGLEGNLHLRNEQIRTYCREHGKILYDFADIETYDPDGNYLGELYPTDTCNTSEGNWAQDYQASHTEGVDWYSCSCAHSEPVNCNHKAYAAWWLWARLAGWDGS